MSPERCVCEELVSLYASRQGVIFTSPVSSGALHQCLRAWRSGRFCFCICWLYRVNTACNCLLGANLVAEGACTYTKNTVCGCPLDYFCSYFGPEDCEFCQRYTVCFPDSRVKERGKPAQHQWRQKQTVLRGSAAGSDSEGGCQFIQSKDSEGSAWMAGPCWVRCMLVQCAGCDCQSTSAQQKACRSHVSPRCCARCWGQECFFPACKERSVSLCAQWRVSAVITFTKRMLNWSSPQP